VTEVTIARISAGGDGVGRLENGMVVFVPRTAPGDRVEIELVEEKRRYARGQVVRVLEAGPDRVEPECPHYVADRCGGCQLQHLTPEAQLATKRAVVGDALRRIGRLDLPDPEITAAPAPWRYRTKITLAAAGERVGLHRSDGLAAVFQLRDCRITREPLMQLWAQLSERRALLPADLEDLVLREDRDGGLHVIVGGGGTEPWSAEPLAQAVARADVSYWWRPRGGAARVVAGQHSAFPALAFEQVNPELGRRIRQEAVDLLGDVGGRTVWDLYGGVGDTAALLAERGASVHSVDQDRSAVEWARRRGLARPQAQFVAGLVEESLHRLPAPDAVVVNPPRAGLSARVCRALDAWGTGRPGARLVYVSCDPATLARDLTRLGGFTVRAVRAYDLFPQTSHVETVALLERA
jgi:23S rRNA (uracil1939-C5)-methyltransferase